MIRWVTYFRIKGTTKLQADDSLSFPTLADLQAHWAKHFHDLDLLAADPFDRMQGTDALRLVRAGDQAAIRSRIIVFCNNRQLPTPAGLFDEGEPASEAPLVKPTVGAKRTAPTLPAEVHNTKPFDADKAWKELQLLCKGN